MGAYSTSLSTQQRVSDVFNYALFSGLYLSTLFSCLRWLIWVDEGWKLRKKIQWTLLAVALFIFACALATVSTILRSLMIEVNHPIIDPKPVPSTGKPMHAWPSIMECTTSNASALAADAVLIYRCWLIYERSLRVVAFPIFMWISGTVCTILQLYWQIIQAQGLDTIWQPMNSTIGPGTVLTPFWGSTILLNFSATVAIAWRLWKIAKENEGVTSTHTLNFLSRVFTESGVLYLVVTTAHLIVWFTPSAFAIALVSDINIPITGIAFNLIIIRTAQERAKENQSKGFGTRPLTSIRFATMGPKDLESQYEARDNSQNIVTFESTGTTKDSDTSTGDVVA
ncbi:hypothetical protein M422DRAFT_254931 [Sphaerobolus stellatus SS14]|uniref:Uncharacterized protein n=1 Tax=Sphaerobolus stellatus (strain SS14) TaxID=990650 RepID=A0A0C9VTS9_SPHS4|nr:hypothetical protein M422DRAFT_254931 [Sphaerobolus stellatus SS14]